MAKKTRRPASAPTLETVKVSVPLDVETHAKLAAYASLRRVPMSTIIASAVHDLVAPMVVFDRSLPKAARAGSPDPAKPDPADLASRAATVNSIDDQVA